MKSGNRDWGPKSVCPAKIGTGRQPPTLIFKNVPSNFYGSVCAGKQAIIKSSRTILYQKKTQLYHSISSKWLWNQILLIQYHSHSRGAVWNSSWNRSTSIPPYLHLETWAHKVVSSNKHWKKNDSPLLVLAVASLWYLPSEMKRKFDYWFTWFKKTHTQKKHLGLAT